MNWKHLGDRISWDGFRFYSPITYPEYQWWKENEGRVRILSAIYSFNNAPQSTKKPFLSLYPSWLPTFISVTLIWNTSDVKHLLTFMSCERSGWMRGHYTHCQLPWPNTSRGKTTPSMEGQREWAPSSHQPWQSARISPWSNPTDPSIFTWQLLETTSFPELSPG